MASDVFAGRRPSKVDESKDSDIVRRHAIDNVIAFKSVIEPRSRSNRTKLPLSKQLFAAVMRQDKDQALDLQEAITRRYELNPAYNLLLNRELEHCAERSSLPEDGPPDTDGVGGEQHMARCSAFIKTAQEMEKKFPGDPAFWAARQPVTIDLTSVTQDDDSDIEVLSAYSQVKRTGIPQADAAGWTSSKINGRIVYIHPRTGAAHDRLSMISLIDPSPANPTLRLLEQSASAAVNLVSAADEKSVKLAQKLKSKQVKRQQRADLQASNKAMEGDEIDVIRSWANWQETKIPGAKNSSRIRYIHPTRKTLHKYSSVRKFITAAQKFKAAPQNTKKVYNLRPRRAPGKLASKTPEPLPRRAPENSEMSPDPMAAQLDYVKIPSGWTFGAHSFGSPPASNYYQQPGGDTSMQSEWEDIDAEDSDDAQTLQSAQGSSSRLALPFPSLTRRPMSPWHYTNFERATAGDALDWQREFNRAEEPIWVNHAIRQTSELQPPQVAQIAKQRVEFIPGYEHFKRAFRGKDGDWHRVLTKSRATRFWVNHIIRQTSSQPPRLVEKTWNQLIQKAAQADPGDDPEGDVSRTDDKLADNEHLVDSQEAHAQNHINHQLSSSYEILLSPKAQRVSPAAHTNQASDDPSAVKAPVLGSESMPIEIDRELVPALRPDMGYVQALEVDEQDTGSEEDNESVNIQLSPKTGPVTLPRAEAAVGSFVVHPYAEQLSSVTEDEQTADLGSKGDDEMVIIQPSVEMAATIPLRAKSPVNQLADERLYLGYRHIEQGRDTFGEGKDWRLEWSSPDSKFKGQQIWVNHILRHTCAEKPYHARQPEPNVAPLEAADYVQERLEARRASLTSEVRKLILRRKDDLGDQFSNEDWAIALSKMAAEIEKR